MRNYRVVFYKRKRVVLCTSGGENSCYNKWKQLETAKKAATKIIDLIKCDIDGVYKKEIEKSFNIARLRAIAERIFDAIKNGVKATVSKKMVLHHLRKLAEIVGLEDKYKQIELQFQFA